MVYVLKRLFTRLRYTINSEALKWSPLSSQNPEQFLGGFSLSEKNRPFSRFSVVSQFELNIKRLSLSESSLSSDMAKDFVHDALKRRGGVDYDTLRGIFFCCVQSFNKFFFFGFSAPVSWVPRHSLINPPKQ
jgi:hypothetical protein